MLPLHARALGNILNRQTRPGIAPRPRPRPTLAPSKPSHPSCRTHHGTSRTSFTRLSRPLNHLHDRWNPKACDQHRRAQMEPIPKFLPRLRAARNSNSLARLLKLQKGFPGARLDQVKTPGNILDRDGSPVLA